MDPVEITAGRLHLRPWQDGDEPALVAAGADPDIQRWTSLPAHTAEQARDYVTREAPLRWANGEHYAFAVCDSTSGAVLGSVALCGRAGQPGCGTSASGACRRPGDLPTALPLRDGTEVRRRAYRFVGGVGAGRRAPDGGRPGAGAEWVTVR